MHMRTSLHFLPAGCSRFSLGKLAVMTRRLSWKCALAGMGTMDVWHLSQVTSLQLAQSVFRTGLSPKHVVDGIVVPWHQCCQAGINGLKL